MADSQYKSSTDWLCNLFLPPAPAPPYQGNEQAQPRQRQEAGGRGTGQAGLELLLSCAARTLSPLDLPVVP